MQIQTVEKSGYDIIVVGGGIAGIAAAVSAARLSKSVLLIEKQINLGGLATVGLINWFEPLCDGEGTRLIGGMAKELIDLAISCGYDNLHEKWGGTSGNEIRYDRFASAYSPTFFSLALDGFVKQNGVQLLLDTYATYPVADGRVCKGVITENADGRSFYPAKAVVDCTGDASIFHRIGAPTKDVENFFTYVVHATDLESVKEYEKSEDMTKLRRWKSVGGDCFGNGHPKELNLLKGTTSKQINEYLSLAKAAILQKYTDTDKNNREILSIPTMPQLRVIRRIEGEYLFTGDEDGKTVVDSIGTVGDFRYKGKRFEVPYRCLYNRQYPNLLTAGRTVSAQGDGMEVLRVIPCCAVTGQAAGIAASLAVDTGRSVADVDISVLQAHIKAQGGLL